MTNTNILTVGKKLSFYALIAAAITFTGCSQKQVEPEAPKEVKQEVKQEPLDQVVTSNETVMTDSSIIGSVNNIHFAFDKYNLTDVTRMQTTNNASALANLKNNGVKLEGNCDSWGSDEYNFALGLKRAKSVKDALVAEGINANNISTVSYGESNPICESDDESCRAQNRRVEFKLGRLQ